MTQDREPDAEARVRARIRGLRNARGWSLDELAGRAHLSPSTLSRLETGHRRLAVDHLVVLARALGTTVDELLAAEDGDDVIIRPVRDTAHGATYWMLSQPDDPSGRIIAKLRLPATRRRTEPKVHPGREWFYVLSGTVRLRLGEREHVVEAGQAAEFDTMTPHRIDAPDGPAELLSIFDRHGEQAHLRS